MAASSPAAVRIWRSNSRRKATTGCVRRWLADEYRTRAGCPFRLRREVRIPRHRAARVQVPEGAEPGDRHRDLEAQERAAVDAGLSPEGAGDLREEAAADVG